MKKILLILFWFISITISATNYYVAKTGNNGNDGSIGSPWLTINYGITQLFAGDFLYVRVGTYVEQVVVATRNGTVGSHITIKEYPGESVIIDGETTLPVGDFTALVRIWSDYIDFYGFEIKNVNTTGTYSSGYGVLATGLASTISYVTVHDAWGGGIMVEGDGSIVEYCLVYDCVLSNQADPGSSGWGTGISACRDQVDGVTDNAILRHNVAHDNWGEGISCFETTGTIMEDNISYDNWSYNMYISDTQDALVQRNFVYTTKEMNGATYGSFGIVLADETHVPPSQNNTAINNIVGNCGTNFTGSVNEGSVVANNTFVDANRYYGVLLWDNGSDGINFTFRNNVIIQNNYTVAILGEGTFDAAQLRGYNLWSRTPGYGFSGTGDVVSTTHIKRTGTYADTTYYELYSASGAVNGGVDLSVDYDYLSVARDASPDIGALEYIIDNPPIEPTVVYTNSVTYGTTTATTGGNVTDDGGGTVSARGVAYGSSTNPTIAGDHTTNGTGTGTFISNITGLSPSTTYHVRAYATNEAGTYYGINIEFTTTSESGLSGDFVFDGDKPCFVKIDGVWYILVK